MKLTIEEAKAMMEKDNGSLILSCDDITGLPDNLTVEGWLFLNGCPIANLPKGLKVKGSLYLMGTMIEELPDAPTVGGSIDLSYSKITKLPDGFTVNGNLHLRGTPITELPDVLTVGGSLDLSHSMISELPDGLTVGEWLDLEGTPITELPKDLIIGGSLQLRRTGITELPVGLTVGGFLHLTDPLITELPDDLTVGGFVTGFGGNTSSVKRLEDGDYIPGRYLYADGILTHVNRKRKFRDYDYFIGKIPGHNVLYDGTYYVHCKDIRDGIRDLAFKHAVDRGADQYRNISVDKQIPTGEMVTMYRVITGACQQGTERFLESLVKLKDSYTIQEAVELTEGQYGSAEFREFFGL